MSSDLSEIPDASWTRRLDEPLNPEATNASSKPPVMEIISLLPVAYRVASYLHTERKAKREPIFDLRFTLGGLEPPNTGPYNGVPLGGLGGGAIGRGYRGDFRRWSLHPGPYSYNIVQGNVFCVRVVRNGEVHAQVLSVFDEDLAKNMSSWNWNMPASKATYHGLFPRAWTVYKEPVPGVNIIIRQVSPIFPNSYSDASLPTGVFIVEVENIGDDEATVSIMFAFENSNGEDEKQIKNKPHASFIVETPTAAVQGVCMSRTRPYLHKEKHGTAVKSLCDQGSLAVGSTLNDMYRSELPSGGNASDSLTVCRKFIVSEKFQTGNTAKELWERFVEHGEVSSFNSLDNHNENAEVASAVCLKKTLAPKQKKDFPFALAWDNPIARFGEGRGHYKYYTSFFGKSGTNAPSICAYALANVEDWERRICEWQNPILNNTKLPRSYKSLLFNELYYLVDGGTIWTLLSEDERVSVEDDSAPVSIDLPKMQSLDDLTHVHVNTNDTSDVEQGLVNEPGIDFIKGHRTYGVNKEELMTSMRNQGVLRLTNAVMQAHDKKVQGSQGAQSICGRFLYLEGHEYLMYNTYDVHFYAGFSLIKLWPMIDLSIQRDYARAVYTEDMSKRKMLGHGPKCTRKVKGCVPHDLGSPSEDPWHRVNIYNFQDVCNWKDLGPKFVLQVYRDFIHTQAISFLRDLYPVILEIMAYTQQFDLDGDGMIENSGFPDQTYDIWIAKGIHAYCGGLWITSCFATAAMALLFRDDASYDKYIDLAVRARDVYNKTLWNGSYLNYDSSTSSHHDSIMSDMMAGQWYAIECDLPRILIPSRALSCFKTIFENNVVHFGQGRLKGAVNGYTPRKTIDSSCLQSREVWPGTTYGLAAAMILESGCKVLPHSSSTTYLDARYYDCTTISDEDSQALFSMAMQTTEGIFNAAWTDFGYWYATPEGWEVDGSYRSKGYMRPLSVWAVQSAIDKFYS